MSAPSLIVLRHDATRRSRLRFRQTTRILAALFCAGLILIAPPLTLGAHLELLLNPVLSAQTIRPETVTLAGDRLCWTWARDKMRAPDVVDLNVVLVTADGDRSYPEVFDDLTGVPWHRGGALPPGHYENRFCVHWPKFVAPDQQVRVRQTLSYAGLLGLWTLRVALPEIVSP